MRQICVRFASDKIEAWGRGTIKIVESCRQNGLPEPDFIEEHGVMKVIFYKDIYNEEYLRKLGLNERQIRAVMYLKEKGEITISEFKKMIPNVSEKTLYRDLKELVSKGLLVEVGEKKGRKYTFP